MNNPEIAYIFNGKRILEKKIKKFQIIDSVTTFTHIEDIGIVIFERNEQKVKKGEVFVALDKRVFGDEYLIIAKTRLDKLQSDRNVTLQNRNTVLAWIKTKNREVQSYDSGIARLDAEIEELKDAILNHMMENNNDN
jgi:hypothetical protein